MASRKEILNRALAWLNEDETPAESGDTATNAAIKVGRFLDAARDAVLARYGWRQCLDHRTLTVSAEVGEWRYPYYYYLPGDCVRVWSMSTADVAWEAGTRLKDGAERQVIKADSAGPLEVSLVRAVGWDGLPQHLVRPIALQAAADACLVVNGNGNMAESLELRAARAIRSAMGIDAGQKGGQAVPLPDRMAALRQSAG